MNKIEENKAIALSWFKAFNEKDLANLLALYHPNAKHYSPKLKINRPETKGLIIGKEALEIWWQDAFTRLPSLYYEVVKLTASEEQVFMEYVRKVSGEEDLYVGEVLVIENGVIVASRVFHS